MIKTGQASLEKNGRALNKHSAYTSFWGETIGITNTICLLKKHELGDLILSMQTLQTTVTQADDNAVINKHTQEQTRFLHFFDNCF